MADEKLLDAPNQQVVRPDGSHPSDEGEGGSTHKKAKAAAKEESKEKEAGK
jgi:hypothetical protein